MANALMNAPVPSNEPASPEARAPLRLSVVICTKDRPDFLARTLDTIWRQSRLPDELAIIDDGRLDHEPIAEMARKRGVDFVYHNKSDRPGLARSRRAGIEHSSGDVILFLDDDVSLEDGYIEAVMNVYESDADKRIGGVTGKLLGTRYRPFQMLLLRIFGMDAPRREGQMLKNFTGVLVRTIDRPIEVQWMGGFNMSYRREALAGIEIPRHIEDCIMSEDRVISYQVGLRWRLIATPQARLVHHKVATGRVGRVRGFEEVYYNHLAFRRYMPQDLSHRVAFAWLCVGYVVINLMRRDWRRALGNLRGIRRILTGSPEPWAGPGDDDGAVSNPREASETHETPCRESKIQNPKSKT